MPIFGESMMRGQSAISLMTYLGQFGMATTQREQKQGEQSFEPQILRCGKACYNSGLFRDPPIALQEIPVLGDLERRWYTARILKYSHCQVSTQ